MCSDNRPLSAQHFEGIRTFSRRNTRAKTDTDSYVDFSTSYRFTRKACRIVLCIPLSIQEFEFRSCLSTRSRSPQAASSHASRRFQTSSPSTSIGKRTGSTLPDNGHARRVVNTFHKNNGQTFPCPCDFPCGTFCAGDFPCRTFCAGDFPCRALLAKGMWVEVHTFAMCNSLGAQGFFGWFDTQVFSGGLAHGARGQYLIVSYLNPPPKKEERVLQRRRHTKGTYPSCPCISRSCSRSRARLRANDASLRFAKARFERFSEEECSR